MYPFAEMTTYLKANLKNVKLAKLLEDRVPDASGYMEIITGEIVDSFFAEFLGQHRLDLNMYRRGHSSDRRGHNRALGCATLTATSQP